MLESNLIFIEGDIGLKVLGDRVTSGEGQIRKAGRVFLVLGSASSKLYKNMRKCVRKMTTNVREQIPAYVVFIQNYYVTILTAYTNS